MSAEDKQVYDDVLVRRDGRWLLAAVTLTVSWRQGDPSIMEPARAAGARLLETTPGGRP